MNFKQLAKTTLSREMTNTNIRINKNLRLSANLRRETSMKYLSREMTNTNLRLNTNLSRYAKPTPQKQKSNTWKRVAARFCALSASRASRWQRSIPKGIQANGLHLADMCINVDSAGQNICARTCYRTLKTIENVKNR